MAGCVKWTPSSHEEKAGKSTSVSDVPHHHHGYHLPGQMSLSDYPLFPQLTPESMAALPSLSQQTAAAMAAASTSAASSANHGGYLLPSIFAQSSVYSGDGLAENSDAHNHISADQQALMTALENLVLQAEAVELDKAGKRSLSQQQHHNGEESFNGGGSPSQQPEGEGRGGRRPDDTLSHPGDGSSTDGLVMWSATDVSKLPQFSIGSLGSSPIKQDLPPSSSSSSGQPNQQSSLPEGMAALPMPATLDKHYLTTFQNQMLASLERASFYMPGVTGADEGVPGKPVPGADDVTPGKPVPGVDARTKAAPDNTCNNDADLNKEGEGQDVGVAHSSSLIHRKVPQPIYSPDISRLKQLTHRVQGGETLTPEEGGMTSHPLSSLLLDSNFSLDIPPPREITESVSRPPVIRNIPPLSLSLSFSLSLSLTNNPSRFSLVVSSFACLL